MKANLICVNCGTQVGTIDAPEIQEGIEYGILCACGGEIKRVLVDE
jgi:hypothetical protein